MIVGIDDLRDSIAFIAKTFTSLSDNPEKAVEYFLETFSRIELQHNRYSLSSKIGTPPKMNEFYKKIRKE